MVSEPDPEPNPDPLDRGTDPDLRISTKRHVTLLFTIESVQYGLLQDRVA